MSGTKMMPPPMPAGMDSADTRNVRASCAARGSRSGGRACRGMVLRKRALNKAQALNAGGERQHSVQHARAHPNTLHAHHQPCPPVPHKGAGGVSCLLGGGGVLQEASPPPAAAAAVGARRWASRLRHEYRLQEREVGRPADPLLRRGARQRPSLLSSLAAAGGLPHMIRAQALHFPWR